MLFLKLESASSRSLAIFQNTASTVTVVRTLRTTPKPKLLWVRFFKIHLVALCSFSTINRVSASADAVNPLRYRACLCMHGARSVLAARSQLAAEGRASFDLFINELQPPRTSTAFLVVMRSCYQCLQQFYYLPVVRSLDKRGSYRLNLVHSSLYSYQSVAAP